MDVSNHSDIKPLVDDGPPRLLEDVLHSVPHSPVLLRQMLGMYSSGNLDPAVCDPTPQSPEITGDKIQNNCSLPLSDLYPAVKNSVAQAVAGSGTDAEPLIFGTSFLACADDQCYYVTNSHVAGSYSSVGIVSPDEKYVSYGKIVARDQEHDLVLVEPPANDQRTPIKIGVLPEVGDSLFTIGHPLASPSDVITSGKVKDLGTTLDVKDPDSGTTQHYTDLIKSAVPVFPGNSGGPEFNRDGQVVGIKVVSVGQGSVSIPIQTAIDMIKKQSHIKTEQ